MAQLQFESTLTDTDPFSAVDPVTQTITVSYTSKVEQNYALSTTSPVLVWDPGNASSPATVFAGLYAVSDGDADLELGATISAVGTDAAGYFSIRLAAGAAFFLGADDTYFPAITDAAFHATQSATTIDRVRLLNPTASTTVNVRIVLVA